MYPLSLNELNISKKTPKEFTNQILKGFYPAIYDRKIDAVEYYENYLNTYVERDVRTIQNIEDLSNFTKFLQILAGRIGQLLNLNEIAGQVGVSNKTISSWISILQASYIILLLEPHYKNYGKRIIKSPKVYFTDVGLAANLLRLDSEKEISNYYGLGSLFENLVILDIYKNILNSKSISKIYFFRDKHGLEVDLLIDKGLEIEPIEIKSSFSFNNDFFKGIEYYKNLSKSKKDTGALIYSGETTWDMKNIKVLNYKDTIKIKL